MLLRSCSSLKHFFYLDLNWLLESEFPAAAAFWGTKKD